MIRLHVDLGRIAGDEFLTFLPDVNGARVLKWRNP